MEKEQLLPSNLKETIKKSDNYLFIFIPGEEQAKINILPIGSLNIKKILIKLEKFSPDLVKGISEVLIELGLNDNLIHTTGLCFSKNRECYYETYVDLGKSDVNEFKEENIKENFLEVNRVIDLCIINITKDSCS
ncbi:MAG: hypothetical protein GF364_01215 [Candidatus Lokiarchaeota archaeon]|nr:hypothetical protein [Candidatus Lokiarchaeota archaeon]